jgi:hypothetical protein
MLVAIRSYLSEIMRLIKRSLGYDTEINLSENRGNIAEVNPYIRKLPKELLDLIGCYSLVISYGYLLLALG